MSMTAPFDVSKSEVISRAVALSIPLAQEASTAEMKIHQLERCLFDGLLAVGGKLIDAFLKSQGNGNLGEKVQLEVRTLHRSQIPLRRPLRTTFGQHQFEQFVYRTSSDLKSEIAMRRAD